MTKTRFVLAGALTGALALAAAALALAAPATMLKLKAQLNAGQEVPPQAVHVLGGSGRWQATLNGTTLKWTLTFSHLSGPANAAHVHMAARGKSGAIIIPLCGPCTSGVSGSATVTASQKRALLGGNTYVNIHTAKNPAGEIRGQVTKAM